MKKYYYYYSDSLGMDITTDVPPEIKELYSESRDESYIKYYKNKKSLLIKGIEESKKAIEERTKKLEEHDFQFEYLKEKYPEEFV